MTDPIEDIKIHVQKSLLPYVLSKPIHPSQNVIEEQEDGSAIISINVIPNYELYQTLLSHGSGITVLSPAHVRDEIKTKIQENLGYYE